MMAYYNTGKQFSMVYVTYDHKKGAGGVVKDVALATKHYKKPTQGKAVTSTYVATDTSKNPNHFSNSTINIKIPAAGQALIRKVHVQLIRRFNGAIVK